MPFRHFSSYVNGIMADSARSTASHGEFIQPPGRGPARSHCQLGWLVQKSNWNNSTLWLLFQWNTWNLWKCLCFLCKFMKFTKRNHGVCLGFIGGYQCYWRWFTLLMHFLVSSNFLGSTQCLKRKNSQKKPPWRRNGGILNGCSALMMGVV